MLELLTDTTLSLAQSAARHGEGLFETLRVRAGVALRLEAHLERMAAGAQFLGLDEPPSAGRVRAFLEAHTACRSLAGGALRLLAVDGNLFVTVEAWEPRLPETIEVGISQDFRRYTGNPLNRFKTLSYLENRLLAREAERRGLFEALALNEAGRLADGGRTNLFWVSRDRLFTPPVAEGALPGVARRVLLEAGLAGEAVLTLPDLIETEALLLTNSLQGGVPVHGLAGRNGALRADHPLLLEAVALLG